MKIISLKLTPQKLKPIVENITAKHGLDMPSIDQTYSMRAKDLVSNIANKPITLDESNLRNNVRINETVSFVKNNSQGHVITIDTELPVNHENSRTQAKDINDVNNKLIESYIENNFQSALETPEELAAQQQQRIEASLIAIELAVNLFAENKDQNRVRIIHGQEQNIITQVMAQEALSLRTGQKDFISILWPEAVSSIAKKEVVSEEAQEKLRQENRARIAKWIQKEREEISADLRQAELDQKHKDQPERDFLKKIKQARGNVKVYPMKELEYQLVS